MALAMTGAGGLRPLSAQGAPSAGGISLDAPQKLSFEIPNQSPDFANSWLAQDTAAPTIDWSMFAPVSGVGYDSLFDRSYSKKAPKLVGKHGNPWEMGVEKYNPYTRKYESPFNPLSSLGMLASHPGVTAGMPKPAPKDTFSGRFAVDPNKINFTDPTIDKAIDAMNSAVYGKLQPVASWDQKLNYGPSSGNNLYDAMQRIAPKPAELGLMDEAMLKKDVWDMAPAEMLRDQALRDQLFGSVAKQYGLDVNDFKGKYNTYADAFRSVADPVGANWQDLKRMGAAYASELLPGVRKFSGYNDSFFNNLNNSVSAGTRNSGNFLPAEYFALHTVSPDNRYMGKRRGPAEMVGNTNPMVRNMFDQYYKPDPGIGGGRKDSPMNVTNPYAMTDWTDYLTPGLTTLNATGADRAAAMSEYEKQKRLRSEKVGKGGQFNLWREMDTDPYQVTKTKGGKWRPRNSGYTNQLNIAQNFLSKEGDGEQSFKTAGFNENDAWKSGFYFDKKKKSMLGSGLGLALGLASFIPGPVGIAAKIGSAVNSVANKDYLGAVLGGLSFLPGGNPLSKVTAGLSKATKLPASVANAIVQGGIGGLGALNNSGNFFRGALGSGLGSFVSGQVGAGLGSKGFDPTVAGAVSGASGNLVNAGIQGAKDAPLLLSAAQGALSGYGRGSDVRRRQQQRRTVRA